MSDKLNTLEALRLASLKAKGYTAEQIAELSSAMEDIIKDIDYIDVWLFATPNDGDMPTGYTQRSVSISARERAVTDENRIEVVMDG